MNKTLREGQKDRVEEEELLAKRSGRAPHLETRGECPAGITKKQLKEFLFREHAGTKVDERVREHVDRGACPVCRKRIVHFKATEPFLYGEEQLPAPHVEVIDEESEESLRNKELIVELSRQMAAAMATPTEPFSLDYLLVMNARVRTTSDKEGRRLIAGEVVETCQARWRRLKSDNQPNIEAAAARLMTLISAYRSDSGRTEVTLDELRLTPADENAFLLYMMTQAWFIHPEGESTWDVKYESGDPANIGNQENDDDATSQKQHRRVVLLLDVLKQAPKSQSSHPPRREPRPINV